MGSIFFSYLICILVGNSCYITSIAIKKLLGYRLNIKWYYALLKVVLFSYFLPIIYMIYLYRNRFDISEGDESAFVVHTLYTSFFNTNRFYFVFIIYFIILFLGTTIILLYNLYKQKKYMRTLEQTRYDILIDEKNIFHDILKAEGIKADKVKCFRTPLEKTPFIIKGKEYCIYLPNITLSKQELAYIFYHEMIHYLNYDLLYRQLLLIFYSIFWINPISHYFLQEFQQASEMNVDFLVLSKKEKKINPKEYFNLMLEFGVKEYKNTLQQVYFSNKKSGMERRITEMLNRNKNKKQMAIFSFIMLLVSMPITTYASVGLIEEMDSKLMFYVIEQDEKSGKNMEIIEEVKEPEIYEETVNLDEIVRGNTEILSRGIKNFDITVLPDERAKILTIKCEKAKNVIVNLQVNKSASYSIGLVDTKGKGTFQEGKGTFIAYNLSTEKAGTYYIVVNNTSSSKLNFSGNINIQ